MKRATTRNGVSAFVCYNWVTLCGIAGLCARRAGRQLKSLQKTALGIGVAVLAVGLLEQRSNATQSYTLVVPPGASLIANQLDHGSNTADVVFSNTNGVLDTSSISTWNCNGTDDAYFDSGSTTGFSDSQGFAVAPPTLTPGEAFFFNNNSTADLTLTFTGTPHVPVLPAILPCGYGRANYLSRQTNDVGTYASIVGLPPTAGAQEQIWAGSGFGVFTYANGTWTPTNPPTLAIGQGAVFVVPTGTTVPAITQQPQAQTNAIGGTATFSITAVGTPPLTYTWIFCPKPNWNFTDVMEIIPGGNSPILTLSNLQATNAGDYVAIVNNASGSVTSSIAGLTLYTPVTLSYNVDVQSGLNLIANQLDHGSNTLDEVLQSVPDGSVLYKYDNAGSRWSAAVYDAAGGSWAPGGITLSPGEGAFFQSPSNFVLAFTGHPHVPVLPVTIPSGGCYLLSRQTNDVGDYTNIVGNTPANGADIYTWNAAAQSYTVAQFSGGSWGTAGSTGPTVPVGAAAWISLPNGGPPPPAPQSLVYQGLLNTGLGSATLTLAGSQLDVANLGSSGQDGVSIALPDDLTGLDVHWQPLDASDSLPAGSFIQEQIIGAGASSANGLLGTVTMTKAGSGDYVVSADFSPISASTYTVQGYRNGVLVAQATGQPGASLATCNIYGDSGCIPRFPTVPGGGWDWPDPGTLLTIGTSASVSVDRLYVLPENVAGTATAVQIVASQISGLNIVSENASLVFQGLTNTTLGNATQVLSSNRTTISNLGSSGQDGVSLGLNPGNNFAGTWLDLDPGNALPAGAYIESQVVGTAGTVTNGVLGSTVCTKTSAGGYAISVDYSPLGSSSHTVQVFNGSVLVAQLTGQTGPICATVKLPPGTCTINPWLNNEWPSPTDITIVGGPTVVGTELLMLPEGATPVSAITGGQILAANIPTITIVNEGVSVSYGGLTHTALGNASLLLSGKTKKGGPLIIQNLGSSGQDGVSISLNRGNNFAGNWQDLDPGNALPIGAYVESQMVGTAGMVTNGVLGSTFCTKAGTSNYVISVDYSPLGSPAHTVQVFNGPVLVAQLTGQPGTFCATVKLPPWICTINPYLNNEWPTPVEITLNGGLTVLGTEILMVPEGAPPVTAVSAEQILAAGIPSITITDETISVNYAGLEHTALGDATLLLHRQTNDMLTVANLGSSGQDGVFVALATNVGTYFQALWQPLDPTNGLPPGAYIQSEIFGTAGTVANGPLGWWRLTKLGTSSYAVTADYSAMGSTTLTVQVYNGANLVATRTGQSGPLGTIAGCVDDDEHGNPVPTGPYGIPLGPFGGALTMFGPLDIGLADGTAVTGDRFVVLPESTTTVSSLSGVQLTASGISQIVITNEQGLASLGQLHNDTLAYYYAHNPIPQGTRVLTLDQLVSMMNVNSNFLASTGVPADQIGQAAALLLQRFDALGMFQTNGTTVYLAGPVVHDQWVPYVLNYLSQQGGPITALLADKIDVVNSMTSAGDSSASIFNYVTNDFINGPWSPSELQVATAFVDIYTHSSTYWTGPNAPAGSVVDHTALWDCVGGLLLWETGPGSLVGAALMSEAAGGGQSIVAPNPTSFGGFTNNPLAGSLLDVQEQNLVCEAVSEGTPFGLSIPLISGLGLDVHWLPLDPTDALPVGAYVQEQINGSANGIADGPLGTITMTKAGTSNYVVSADFSAIGAKHYTVQAFLNGVLVAQATNQNGASLATCNIWGDSGCIPTPPPLRGGWDWTNTDTLLTIAGSASVLCDHLYVTPENVSGTATALQFTATQIPALAVTSENASLLYGGLDAAALGKAIVRGDTNRLVVSNLGSSGQDGVELSLPGNNLTNWAAHWPDLDADGALPVGAYMRESLIGTGGTVTNGLLGTVTTTKTGIGAYSAMVDFSPMGVSTFTTAVYNGTNLVHQVSGMTNGQAAALFDFSLSVHIYLRPLHFVGDGSIGPINIDPVGDDFTAIGNNVVFTPDGGSQASASALRMELSQIPSLAITNETVSPLVLKSTVAGGTLQLQWLGSGLLQQSPDLLNWNDTTNLPGIINIGSTNQFYRVRQAGGEDPF